MSRNKKNNMSISVNGKELGEQIVDALLEPEKKPYEIVEAHLKDGFCYYIYQITKGLGTGEKHKVDGAGMAKDDLLHTFGKLHVHMAAIDGIFQHSRTHVDSIDDFHNHELTDLYYVSGVKFYGSEDNEMVVLIGSKRVAFVGGRSNFVTPKIPLDSLSSYTWHQELAEIIAKVKEEVCLYKEGNYILPEQEEEEDGHKKKMAKVKQRTIGDEINERQAESSDDEGNHADGDETDIDFESAKK